MEASSGLAPSRRGLPLACAVAAVAWGGAVRAQEAATPSTLAPLDVTATRVQVPAFDVAASTDPIELDPSRSAQAQVNLSEHLGGVPVLLARDHQNCAQDLQISVRGFGARSAFGIRGVRLYVDEIPATLPDGQGQISNVDLGSAERVEVLRGPFSALYGNASGGVILVFTDDGRVPPALSVDGVTGSAGLVRLGTKVSGRAGGFGYRASASRMRTDGYREHSAAERSIANRKATLAFGHGSRLTLIANRPSLPSAQDPLGLARAQMEADPRSADPAALAFDTRRSVAQSQGGAVLEHRIDARNALRLLVYGGQRAIQQFQSIPNGPQANALHPGGVIVLGRNYSGADLRWTLTSADDGRGWHRVAGLAYDLLNEHRQGYQRRDRHARQQRWPLDLPERRQHAPARARTGMGAPLRRSAARAGERDLARRALPGRIQHLLRRALPDAEPGHPGRQPPARPGALGRAREPGPGAAAGLACRGAASAAEQRGRQRRQCRRRRGLCGRQRQRRLRAARGPLDGQRLRAHRQPVRPPLGRLGHRR
jgi:outer membrane receptor protein involved in Fe transport